MELGALKDNTLSANSTESPEKSQKLTFLSSRTNFTNFREIEGLWKDMIIILLLIGVLAVLL